MFSYPRDAYIFGNYFVNVAYQFGKFCIFISVTGAIMYKREIMAQLRTWDA